ncbi:MAG: hypothetical protein HFI31_07640 [Lachnospiraceae bacterium]|nr:hypothetical protein [Lachnospiraceae bacterium]
MARPRKQTYPLETYLNKNRDGDISNDADTQRKPAWKAIVNGLIVTILTDDYIPPIILAEEENSQLHITDGGSRTAAFMMYRYGNYKIASSMENSMIPYKKKGRDKRGNIVWEDTVFDIKGTTYDQLPSELKKKFNEYQIETVIHEHCDRNRIAVYIKRYNEHSSMNTNQKAFTYIDKFASRIRRIMESKFFADCTVYSENDIEKGVMERMLVETVMCINHFDGWSKQAKNLFQYVNIHGTEKEFQVLEDYIDRLGKLVTEDIKDLFNKKDTFIFLTLFDRFAKLGIEDLRFAEFLRAFKLQLRETRRNHDGLLFDDIKQNNSTKDKSVIADKLNMLEELMKEYLHREEQVSCTVESFLAENLSMDIREVQENLDLYQASLDTLLEKSVKVGSRLRDAENRFSLLAMIAYSYEEDQDLDSWMESYAKKNPAYFTDQKKNFNHMRHAFERYCERERKK